MRLNWPARPPGHEMARTAEQPEFPPPVDLTKFQQPSVAGVGRKGVHYLPAIKCTPRQAVTSASVEKFRRSTSFFLRRLAHALSLASHQTAKWPRIQVTQVTYELNLTV